MEAIPLSQQPPRAVKSSLPVHNQIFQSFAEGLGALFWFSVGGGLVFVLF